MVVLAIRRNRMRAVVLVEADRRFGFLLECVVHQGLKDRVQTFRMRLRCRLSVLLGFDLDHLKEFALLGEPEEMKQKPSHFGVLIVKPLDKYQRSLFGKWIGHAVELQFCNHFVFVDSNRLRKHHGKPPVSAYTQPS